MRARLPLVASLVSSIVAAALAPVARAGGGPETTLVVVNAASPVSRRIANAWVEKRRIPATHVVEVTGVPDLGVVDVETFRARLWAPVRAYMVEHGLSDRIDLIVWSADFPYGVDYRADAAKPRDPPYTPIASLTAMTFFARAVEAKAPGKYLAYDANRYYRRAPQDADDLPPPLAAEGPDEQAAAEALARRDWAAAAEAYRRSLAANGPVSGTLYNYACCLARLGSADEALAALARAVDTGFRDANHAGGDEDLASLRERPAFARLLEKMASDSVGEVQPAIGFRSRAEWTGAADPTAGGGADSLDRYWLSTSLAYTGEWGSSAAEALHALEASIGADGTDPKGTFYFLSNGDVRATTRAGRFEGAVEALRARGRQAEILAKDADGQTGVLPIGKTDVLGAMIGIPDFSWPESKSRILPGAIVEHLTSFGAVFRAAGQTKCTAFVRAGAAGTSGAVNEPYALEAKFPVPHVHVHYADGCSLAESFFQSVRGPYQLLVIGDGLARPFAKFAKVSVGEERWTGTGTIAVKPVLVPASERPIAFVELWIDGAFVAQAAAGETLTLDTTALDDGPHEARAVAVEADRVATRSFGVATLDVRNGTRRVTLDGDPKKPRPAAAYEGSIALSGSATASAEVVVLAGARELARVPAGGGTWKASFPASRLGVGTTLVHARATGAQGAAAVTPVATIVVSPPALRRGVKATGAKRPFVATVTPTTGRPLEVALASLGGAGLPSVRETIAAKVKDGIRQLVVEGEFDVAEAGAYQFLVNARGAGSLDVDGKPALPATALEADRQAYVYVSLAAGRHALKFTLAPDGAPGLTILLGGDRVTAPLESK